MIKKQKTVSVKKGVYIWLKNGDYKIRCDMTDNSVWECNKEYKNWKCVKPSDEVLTGFFHEEVKN